MLKNLQLKKHALTGVSFMLPLVVASGLLIAIGNLAGGNPSIIKDYKDSYTIWQAAVSLGVFGMGLIPAVMSAAIAYSIADRPGIAPGLLMGMIANAIGAGFLGGMLGGYLAGYFVNFLKNNLKLPKWAQGLMPMMIIPLLSSIVIGLLMFFVIGGPIASASRSLTNFLRSMNGGSKVIFGAIMGAMAAFDFGGPVNKVASLFADGLLAEGIYGPEAIKICASMIPPFGVTLSWLIKKSRYSKQEAENIKIAFPMGICMITEGVIPIAAVDPIRVIFSCSFGAAIGGILIMLLGVGSPVPSGGMFIVPAMHNPLGFLIALSVGSIITAILLVFLKKDAIEEDTKEDEDEEELDLSSIKIN
ncbi:PTS fructose transporter subunit IIC [Thermoanaerobacterium sp. CMT5567-10]|uniref:PTS fructose transporter subunit IIC n=1 Tax=Thermoanaerobacterium sp. CMT5567-10 TaxID=3061989 RepID=UPI0026DFB680|nr:PTS fructose transporter subunit IIC [Thermoanaerobacterium sp. CMT5567-10]WKV08592.1 PTS fructose transporter subunit IIC [Thermoanaerobacterium sp. CMT5567-10]